ncbi:MAG: OmpA family protein [Brumimicrobium sp.]|nr:OmpA family protein [Brumimicrobium sp.]
MKLFSFLLFLFCTLTVYSQTKFTGTWKGFIKSSAQSPEKADVLYLKLGKEENNFTGKSRVEVLHTDEFALKSLQGTMNENSITLKEDYISLSSNSRNAPKCKMVYDLSYNDSTGYLEGSFKSSDCRNTVGRVVLYRTDDQFNEERTPTATHYWKQNFVKDYEKGFPAPEIREQERKDFQFKPIYFDHDKAEIRPEYFDYLNKMARILEGIHDLRVKVTGHTDAVGTDEYNIELSKRRAKAIKDYFKSRGIEPEKLEIDFKGERQPVDTNNTPAGKQRNRRVDFEFI